MQVESKWSNVMRETQQSAVTVAESGSGPYSQIVSAGRHVLSADEPQIRGGHDVGPSPYEFLSAGLGACTAMTLRAYVERHNWDLRRVIVEVRHEKAVAVDGTPIVDQFHRMIHLDGDLSEEQRLKVLQVAETCPASETLRHSSIVEARLADVPFPVPA
jgi:putative redox protein